MFLLVQKCQLQWLDMAEGQEAKLFKAATTCYNLACKLSFKLCYMVILKGLHGSLLY